MAPASFDKHQWLDRLHQSGYRLTAPRRVIVNTLLTLALPLHPGELHECVRKQYPHIGRMTVYRTLEQLETLGLLRRLHQGCHAYIPASPSEDTTLICENCGETMFLACDWLPAWLSQVEEESGFVMGSHGLQLFGVCRNCQPVPT